MGKKPQSKNASTKKSPARKTGKSTKKKVVFSLDAPHADNVALAGSFNNWDLTKHPMKKDAKGVWKKSIMLEPGEYEYKFLVGHDWWLDPACNKTVSNPFGGLNSLITV